MSLRDLRPHQALGMEMLKQSLRSGKRRPMFKAACGFGKTVVAAHIVAGARAKGNRLVFCVPSLSLIDQSFDRFVENGIDPSDMGVIQGDHAWKRPHAPIQIATPQTLARRELPLTDIVVIDEAHVRFGVYETWMNSDAMKGKVFIGLSATPWAKGLGLLFDDLISPITMRELIEQGYLSPFRVFAPGHVDLTGVKTVAGDFHEGQLATAMSKPKLVADIVSNWMEKGPGEKTLCFAVNRAHAQLIHDQFLESGIASAYVDAFTPREEREAIGRRLASGEVKVVCNIGTLTTGVDWDVRCIILARPTKSESLFCLDAETEILTSHGWKGMGEIKEGHCVAACEGSDTSKGRWSRVVATVERDMRPDESWVEYDAPRANFRVTDRHRMIFEGGNETGGFRIATAREMAACKGGAKTPTAVRIAQAGVPLTDDELYFIGMMMTDGTWTATGGSISQSERHPAIVGRIEAALKGCGIGYAKRRVIPQVGAIIAERNPRWVFHFSAGKPKPNGALGRPMCGNETKEPYTFVTGITGYRHLMPFMDKDLAPALMQISRAQLVKLLEGIWDGDGSKKLNVGYEPKTLEICSARKPMLDRLQALCAVRGMTANLRCENGSSRATPIYLLSITDKPWRSCGGYASTGKNGGAARNQRPQIEINPATNERVWCVETEHGTIVTRRRGKVTVMGNCQIIGRGLRTAEEKDYLVVFDHSDTHTRLGMVDEIDHCALSLAKPGKGEGDDDEDERPEIQLPAPCPACGCLIPPAAQECPDCGFRRRKKANVEQVDGELQELERGGKSKKPKPGGARLALVEMGKSEVWGQIQHVAAVRGWSDGRAANCFREIFGVWPNAVRHDAHREPSMQLLGWIRAKSIAYAKSRQAEATE